jgi:hypothetical protein
MDAKTLIQKLNVPFANLPGKLDATSSEQFCAQFKELFSSSAARNARSVVYIWSTTVPIPRLRSQSNVVYIGKTLNTLFERHHKYASVEANGKELCNWQRYEHIIQNHGPITISYAVHANPANAEKDLLKLYFDEHLELPPLNRKY